MPDAGVPEKKKNRTLLMTSVALIGVLCLTLLAMWFWRGSRESASVSPTTQRNAVPASAPGLETDGEAGMSPAGTRPGGIH